MCPPAGVGEDEQTFDDSHVIIGVLAIAGCLIVVVAFLLVGALVRKHSSSGGAVNASKMAAGRNAIVWSKVDACSAGDDVIAGQMTSSVESDYSAAGARNGFGSGGIVAWMNEGESEEKNEEGGAQAGCVGEGAGDIILTLDSEPVSYAVSFLRKY